MRVSVTPEGVRSAFDQVKDEVAKDWRSDEARTKVTKYAQGLVDSLNGGKTLEVRVTDGKTESIAVFKGAVVELAPGGEGPPPDPLATAPRKRPEAPNPGG